MESEFLKLLAKTRQIQAQKNVQQEYRQRNKEIEPEPNGAFKWLIKCT